MYFLLGVTSTLLVIYFAISYLLIKWFRTNILLMFKKHQGLISRHEIARALERKFPTVPFIEITGQARENRIQRIEHGFLVNYLEGLVDAGLLSEVCANGNTWYKLKDVKGLKDV